LRAQLLELHEQAEQDQASLTSGVIATYRE